MRRSLAVAIISVLAISGEAIAAETATVASEDDARFTMTETSEGVLRLDRQTGVVSLCSDTKGRWTCVPVLDAQKELDKEMRALERENERLAARNSELEERLQDIARSAGSGLPDENEKKPEADKDSGSDVLTQREQRQIDRFMDFGEHAMRRFFGVMKTLRDEYEKGI